MSPYTDRDVLAARGLLEPGLVKSQAPQQRCSYDNGRCRKKATETLHTRTVSRDYCPDHFREVLGDIQARAPRRLPSIFKENPAA
jgi:hypothetical protein